MVFPNSLDSMFSLAPLSRTPSLLEPPSLKAGVKWQKVSWGLQTG